MRANTPGFIAGAYLNIGFGGSVSLQPEAYYSQKGAKESELLDTGTGLTIVEGKWKYDYVDVAALLKIRISPPGPSTVHLFVGPVFSTLVKAEATGGGQSLDLDDFTKSSDVGGTVGIGVDLGGFVLDLRYTAMTSEFDEPPLADLFARKHNVISAMIGFGG